MGTSQEGNIQGTNGEKTMLAVEKSVIEICRQKLLSAKSDLLNRMQTHLLDFSERETGGDEVDQSVSQLAENNMFVSHQRMRFQLLEIELALSRIERGNFGICEETDEPIEAQRLLAIPWTRLSIEGAEMRENPASRRA
jgi:DnaK suppressor protein